MTDDKNLTIDPTDKLEALKNRLASMDRVALALSGGLDSSFLAAVFAGIPGLRIMAVTADSCLLPSGELDAARRLADRLDIQHVVVRHDPLADPVFASNPIDRCFFCKEGLFGLCMAAAREQGFDLLADGTVIDDSLDFRPGTQAARSLGVISPLLDAGLSRADIGKLRAGLTELDGWVPKSGACLASRFPPGTSITLDRLTMVRTLEDNLSQTGFKVFRARYFDGLAKLELGEEEFDLARNPAIRKRIIKAAVKAGFHTVAMDLEPYRTGRMNELAGGTE